MDNVVCLECGGRTTPHNAQLATPSATTSRTWAECVSCGWESLYRDVTTSHEQAVALP